MKRLLMLVLPALALAACSGLAVTGAAPTSPSGTVSAATDKVVLDGSRALLLAEDAYQSVAAVTSSLVDAGVIKGATATKVRVLNRTVTDALQVGFASRDAAVQAAQAAKALAAIADIHAAIGK